jgi:hypothetical protein
MLDSCACITPDIRKIRGRTCGIESTLRLHSRSSLDHIDCRATGLTVEAPDDVAAVKAPEAGPELRSPAPSTCCKQVERIHRAAVGTANRSLADSSGDHDYSHQANKTANRINWRGKQVQSEYGAPSENQ